MRRLVCNSDPSTRAGALRALRYAISTGSLSALVLPVFVVCALDRVETPGGTCASVQGRTARHGDRYAADADGPCGLISMRHVALERLRERTLLNVEVVAEADGTKILVDQLLQAASIVDDGGHQSAASVRNVSTACLAAFRSGRFAQVIDALVTQVI
ncbi:hypothetical protein PR001_g3827 [Phytophthora rubi]|nr:hypothetical protein PR001_g3827 [Phytophthora rubi]